MSTRSDARLAPLSADPQNSVVAALQALTDEISAMRSVIQNVEIIASNNGRRLESVDTSVKRNAHRLDAISDIVSDGQKRLEYITEQLQRQDDLHSVAAIPPTDSSTLHRTITSTSTVVAIVLLLLISRRKIRNFLVRALQALPLSMLLFLNTGAGGFLLCQRGLDALEPLLGSSRPGPSEVVALRERRRLLAYALLVASTSCLPAKACVSLIAARSRK
jgi:hypothetical protein